MSEVKPIARDVSQAILSFLDRAAIKGSEAAALLHCKSEVLRVTHTDAPLKEPGNDKADN